MKNKVIVEDCLTGLKRISSDNVDMIYVDPPFFTRKKHKLSDKNLKMYSFEDNWKTLDEYLFYLKERLMQCKRILKDSGLIFVHCDKNASHYIKILMDELFGYKNFVNEIIWSYKRWSNSRNALLNSHQNIFIYSKTKNYNFYKKYVDYSPNTNTLQNMQDRVKINGKSAYKRDMEGNIVFSHEKKGVLLGDVWSIPFLNPKAKERVGYPTQKPLQLLEQIIEISTKENDVIVDPFCGSGSMLVAAKKNNRRYIGFDINEKAVELALKRLSEKIV